MDPKGTLAVSKQLYFDTILYFYILAVTADPTGEISESTEIEANTATNVTHDLPSYEIFSKLYASQRTFIGDLTHSMFNMISLWVHPLSEDPFLHREFTAYAKEKWNLDLPIEFTGKRPNLTLVVNRPQHK